VSGVLCIDVYIFSVYRLVSPFCTKVLHWPADNCIFCM
jgi:hypothetical protein